MQVARMQHPGPRSYARKALEAASAFLMTLRHGRQGVLAHYLRIVPYGNRAHGIAYAARISSRAASVLARATPAVRERRPARWAPSSPGVTNAHMPAISRHIVRHALDTAGPPFYSRTVRPYR